MARPQKKGIDYFSFDIDFFEDEKIEPISGEFGVKGEIIVIRLLCAVYRNGYFAMWNEQLKMTLANRCKVSFELIDQVISRLVKWGFINEHLFNSAKVITSTGIQKRFQEATRKRKYDYSKLDYWLISDKKEVIGGRNHVTSELLAEETPQSKVKYKKEIYKEKDFVVDLHGEKKTVLSTLHPFMQEILNDQQSLERLCMNNSIEMPVLKDFVIEFFVLRTNENNNEIQSVNDAQRYFGNWLRTQLEKSLKQRKENTNGTSTGKLHPALQ